MIVILRVILLEIRLLNITKQVLKSLCIIAVAKKMFWTIYSSTAIINKKKTSLLWRKEKKIQPNCSLMNSLNQCFHRLKYPGDSKLHQVGRRRLLNNHFVKGRKPIVLKSNKELEWINRNVVLTTANIQRCEYQYEPELSIQGMSNPKGHMVTYWQCFSTLCT